MKRHLFEKLLDWKTSSARKPLILMGARQVGKTTLLRAFGEAAYEHVVYLNFEFDPHLADLFADTLNPKFK